LENKVENLEEKTEQQNKKIQTLEAEIYIRSKESNFLFQEYVLKDLKESTLPDNFFVIKK